MWWWSHHFPATQRGEWLWTNEVYYPWVWNQSDGGWYDVSKF